MTTIDFEIERELTLKAHQEVTLESGEKFSLPAKTDAYYYVNLTINGLVEPYIPPRLSGHPDTWHPAEGGNVEIEEILFNGERWTGKLTTEERRAAEEDLRRQAQDDAEEARAEAQIAAYEDRYEYPDDRW